jgi:hypothetical protein
METILVTLSLCISLANLYCMIVFVLPRTEMLNPTVDVFGESETTANLDDDSEESVKT